MKRLGKLVIMTFAEYESLMCRAEDAEAHAADFAEELSRVRDSRREERKRAFKAGVFHASGGYAHALYALRDRLTVAQGLVARYKPIAEIFEKEADNDH